MTISYPKPGIPRKINESKNRSRRGSQEPLLGEWLSPDSLAFLLKQIFPDATSFEEAIYRIIS